MYMDVKIKLNGKLIIDSVDQDMVLLDFCRKHNCFSVKKHSGRITKNDIAFSLWQTFECFA